MKKIGFAELNLKQAPISYSADCYYEMLEWSAYESYLPIQHLFPDEEQLFFALVSNSGAEIILGIDFFYCEINREILMTYMFEHTPNHDEEASEYIVKAFLNNKIINEVRKYYKRRGYSENGIRYWRRRPIVIDIDDYPV
jgi:hypothetical protein